jgi:predicted DNA-binding transcriptional regulator AlpA
LSKKTSLLSKSTKQPRRSFVVSARADQERRALDKSTDATAVDVTTASGDNISQELDAAVSAVRRSPYTRRTGDGGDGDNQLRFIGKPEVLYRVGLSYPTIWKLMIEGKFPRARISSGGKNVWFESEVNDWIRNRPIAPLKGEGGSPREGLGGFLNRQKTEA